MDIPLKKYEIIGDEDNDACFSEHVEHYIPLESAHQLLSDKYGANSVTEIVGNKFYSDNPLDDNVMPKIG